MKKSINGKNASNENGKTGRLSASDDHQAVADDHQLAADLAHQAGQLLLRIREDVADLQITKPQAGELKAKGDRESHNFLLAQLRDKRPDDAVLSEEDDTKADANATPQQSPLGSDSGRNSSSDARRDFDRDPRLDARRVWIIDPLDGTREFGEPPRDDWAVHVALIIDTVPVAGAVALPAQNLLFSTADAITIATTANTSPTDPSPTTPIVIASRSRAGAVPQHIADTLGGKLVFMGSAGVKAMEVVRGRADIYAHTGGQYEWDSAAPVAVAVAAGLHASRIDGSPLIYNQENPYLPDLLICRPEWVTPAIKAAGDLL